MNSERPSENYRAVQLEAVGKANSFPKPLQPPCISFKIGALESVDHRKALGRNDCTHQWESEEWVRKLHPDQTVVPQPYLQVKLSTRVCLLENCPALRPSIHSVERHGCSASPFDLLHLLRYLATERVASSVHKRTRAGGKRPINALYFSTSFSSIFSRIFSGYSAPSSKACFQFLSACSVFPS